MIIENQAMVTDAVLEAVTRTEDPRLREILQARRWCGICTGSCAKSA